MCLGDDVHGSQQRGGAVCPCCRAFEDFNPVNLADVYGEVSGVVSSLGVAYADSVQQDGYLVEGASADAYVSLHSHHASLAYVHAYGEFKKVVYAAGRDGGNSFAVMEA